MARIRGTGASVGTVAGKHTEVGGAHSRADGQSVGSSITHGVPSRRHKRTDGAYLLEMLT